MPIKSTGRSKISKSAQKKGDINFENGYIKFKNHQYLYKNEIYLNQDFEQEKRKGLEKFYRQRNELNKAKYIDFLKTKLIN